MGVDKGSQMRTIKRGEGSREISLFKKMVCKTYSLKHLPIAVLKGEPMTKAEELSATATEATSEEYISGRSGSGPSIAALRLAPTL